MVTVVRIRMAGCPDEPARTERKDVHMKAVRRPTRASFSYPVPTAPVLLAGRSQGETVLEALRQACQAFGWPVVEELDEGRLSWAASVHRPAAVLLPVRAPDRDVRTIADLRAVTAGALVVVGDLASADVVAVLRAGADAVIPTGLPE